MTVEASMDGGRSGPRRALSLGAMLASVCLIHAAHAAEVGAPAATADSLARRALRGSSAASIARRAVRTQSYGLPAHGLDLDDDYTTNIAGMPMERPTRAHEEGDVARPVLIPELVSDVRNRAGPSFVEGGDFAAAGATLISYRNSLPSPIVSVAGGDHGYRRVFAGGSMHALSGTLLGALELERWDGPWANPEDNHKTNAVLRYSAGTPERSLEMTALGYDNRWNATNQVPDRAIASREISRYGTLDPSDGATTHRYALTAAFQDVQERTVSRVSGFLLAYRQDLFSNFTFFLSDTAYGDQIEQLDDRLVAGVHASRSEARGWFAGELVQTIGVELRHDQMGKLGLYRTEARRRLGTIREDRARVSSVSPYVEGDATWMRGLRTVVGARIDGFAFRDDASDPSLSGSGLDGVVSPKAAVILGPWAGFDLSASGGFGFRSEDVRGAKGKGGGGGTSQGVQQVAKHIPTGGGAAARTTPLLIRARGADVSARYTHGERGSIAVSLWGLEMDSEHVFLGNEVTPSQSRPSRRTGIDLSTAVRLIDVLRLSADASYARARFADADPAGDFVPGAVEGVLSAGVECGPWRGAFAGLRVHCLGPRPLIQDDSVRAPGSSIVEVDAGYRAADAWGVELQILNLFDREANAADYYYVSRLHGEPASGIADLHRHPEAPRSVRLALTWGAEVR